MTDDAHHVDEATFLQRPTRTLLTLAEAASIIRRSVKDKTYRATPLGLVVGRYVRWFRNEWGATPRTIGDYEPVLARMALLLADKAPADVTIEDLREVIDLWADRDPRTRAKVTSIIRAFWTWAEDNDLVTVSPATRLRRPRVPRRIAPLLPANADARLLGACGIPRDRAALLFLLDCGIRRGELQALRVRDVDMARREVTVTGKGQKSRVIPLRGRIVNELDHYLLAPLPLLGRPPEPDDHLLYPEKRTAGDRLLAAYPKRPMSDPAIHRWWYKRLRAAGLVGDGVRAGSTCTSPATRSPATSAASAASTPRHRPSATPTSPPPRPSTGTTTQATSNARWRPMHGRSGRPPMSNHSLRPIAFSLQIAQTMEAAGIEPASVDVPA